MEEEIIEESEPWYKTPIKWILSLFLILIILLWLIPAYAVKLDPSPNYIPKIDETFLFPAGNETGNETGTRCRAGNETGNRAGNGAGTRCRTGT